LQPFLALSKSASSPRAAADLITRATSAPNTFIFAELLSTPQIQALSDSPEYATQLNLLNIFSYGTYADYIHRSDLPALNDAQTLKLRQLSFLTLARDPSNLTYSSLIQSLGLSNARELEDLVISAIYAGLITGTLDPYRQLVTVTSVSPLRDLPPDSIPGMLSTLHEWSNRCVSTLADLEKQIASIKAEAMRRQKEDTEWAAHVEKLLEAKDPHGKGANEEQKGSNKSGFGSGLGRMLGAGAASKRGSGGLDGEHIPFR
jgi:COP9 signalosome complex subunit 7